MWIPPRRLALALASQLWIVTLPAATAHAEGVDFATGVRPLLERHCYRCHGARRQKGELRLDRRTAALEGGLSGRVILPGKSAESLLYRYVAGLDEEIVMPPKGKRLAAAEIDLLRRWIDEGAHWPDDGIELAERRASDHWSFQALRRPTAPAVRAAGWVRNPIDRFILARLEEKSFEPSREARPETLIRRLGLDLLGLPPGPGEQERFLADRRAGAYERLVDRFLASPHFGERWGRHWLDVARYADTNGYEKDRPRDMWRYRDWVIDAINRDMPFDEFAVEQLAGDMLPGATTSQIVATGFHRNTMLNDEGGVDQEQFRYEAVIDRVNTTATAFLGLTLACAQCHSHKYDPFTQREYFEFFAFLNNADEPTIEMPTAEEVARRVAHEKAIARLVDELLLDHHPATVAAVDSGGPEAAEIREANQLYAMLNAAQPDWEAEQAEKAVDWTVLEPVNAVSHGDATFTRLPDRSLLVGGPSPQHDTYEVDVVTDLEGVTAFRLEVLPHPSLPGGGPGRGRILGDGDFVLSEVKVTATALEPRAATGASTMVELRNPSADHAAEKFPVAHAVDGDIETGWSIGSGKPGMHVPRYAVFETKEPIGFPAGTRLRFTLVHYYVHEHTIGRLRLSATTAPAPVKASGLPAAVESILLVPAAERTPEQKLAVKKHYRSVVPELKDLQQEIAGLRAKEVEVTTALVMKERGESRETRVHIRGEFLKKGDAVQPDVPEVLPPLADGQPRNRLGLARWIVSERNPLTARVTVNRVWQTLFGRGLVTTSEDFGTQGEPPTHPELLDWLAGEFARDTAEGGLGWRLKDLLRLIVTSATYRQSARLRPENTRRDPYNQLLSSAPRHRVEAETVRDIALAASGLLTAEVGGPSVFPPQPEGITGLSYGKLDWKTSRGAQRYRRGLYTYWKRTSPYPGFTTFDCPSADTTCVRRVRTNTPLQALTLLNDPVFLEAARALAGRVLDAALADDAGRVRLMFRLVVGRSPDAGESAQVLAFVEEQRRRFRGDEAAAALVALGEGTPPAADASERAAWTVLGRALLNLDEAITRP